MNAISHHIVRNQTQVSSVHVDTVDAEDGRDLSDQSHSSCFHAICPEDCSDIVRINVVKVEEGLPV